MTMAPEGSTPQPVRSDRIPPYSEEAERGVLGSALLDAQRVVDLALERGLSAESFYVPAHQTLFEVLTQMMHEGLGIDLVTVGDRLRAQGRLEDLGGLVFLERLVDSTPTAAHAEYYVEIVRQKHLLRSIIQRAREAMDQCFAAEEETADILLGKVEQAFFDIGQMKRSLVTPWPDLVKHAVEEIEKIATLKKGITGVATGFVDLDRYLLGLQPGDMIVLAARPSMGKTSLALNIVENVSLGLSAGQAPLPVAIFSLEMSKEQLVRRMICTRAGVEWRRVAGGFVSTEHHGRLITAAAALNKAPIYLDDSAGLEALELRARARRLKRKYDIQLVVVDYLQMINFPQFAREGRQRETAAISGALKAMAKELRVPVLVLSQLSRAPETRTETGIPRLSDLRDSGSIEQDADVVLLLRRPCKYPNDEQHEDQRLAIVEIAKQRNGPTGIVQLDFDEEFTRFGNRARPVGYEAEYQPAAGGAP